MGITKEMPFAALHGGVWWERWWCCVVLSLIRLVFHLTQAPLWYSEVLIFLAVYGNVT